MKKLNIEIDEAGKIDVFVNGEKISSRLIDTIYLSWQSQLNWKSENPNDKKSHAHVEITFLNLLGGLYECEHATIIKNIKESIIALEGLPVETSMRFQLNTDRLFDEYGENNGKNQ